MYTDLLIRIEADCGSKVEAMSTSSAQPTVRFVIHPLALKYLADAKVNKTVQSVLDSLETSERSNGIVTYRAETSVVKATAVAEAIRKAVGDDTGREARRARRSADKIAGHVEAALESASADDDE